MRRAVVRISSAVTSQPVTLPRRSAPSAKRSVKTPTRNLHRIADSIATSDALQQRRQNCCVAETQTVFLQESFLRTFHRERDRRAGRNRVEPPMVAEADRFEHGGLVVNAAERAESEEAFIFQA